MPRWDSKGAKVLENGLRRKGRKVKGTVHNATTRSIRKISGDVA